jgi:hypothetical protein
MKHTPAPWLVVGSTVLSGEYPICKTPLRDRRVSDSGAWGAAHAEANCRLIAAAPELLAACNELLSCVMSYYEGPRGQDYSGGSISRAKAAIAKAEGLA